MDGFRPVSGKEKAQIISRAQFAEASVFFKFVDTMVYKTSLFPIVSKSRLACRKPSSLPRNFDKKRVTLNFVIEGEIYFMVAHVHIDGQMVFFSGENELFHLARRKHRRTKIPSSYESILFIRRRNGELAFSRGSILNLNKSGFRAVLNVEHPLLKEGDHIEGKVSFNRKQSISIKGTVRHHRTNLRGPHKQSFGVRFEQLSKTDEARIVGVALGIEREQLLVRVDKI